MTARRGSIAGGLLLGLAIGLVFVLVPVLLLGVDGVLRTVLAGMPLWSRVLGLIDSNLQGSVAPFSLVLAAYGWQLRALRHDLSAPEPELECVARREQLLDLCASLFFGIGVIWTAVGMREALISGLGNPALAAREGAFSILHRLVDGGILTALSTTIVGGIGGYLMRVLKSPGRR